MNLAYKGKLASGDECEEELKLLLKESNPLESGDWRLDPVLQRACQVSSTSNFLITQKKNTYLFKYFSIVKWVIYLFLRML